MTDTTRPGSRRRSFALGVVAFLATLILLFGLSRLVGQTGGRPTSSAGTGASGVATATSPSPGAAGAASPGDSAGASGSTGPAPGSSGSGAPPSSASAGPTGDPVLVGAGDIAACGLDDDSATADLVEANPGNVFTAGDNAYPDGTLEQFRDCYGPTWGRFLDRTRPAAGNHDWVTDDLAGYFGYFGAAAKRDDVSWYSYDLGRWHIIVLDSDCDAVDGCDERSEQGQWLNADLAASTAPCTLAIWHHPRFSSGEHGDAPNVGPFWTALYDADADVIVNGHDHDYERFAAQDPSGNADGARGIREFVVGTGGAALRSFPRTAPNSELRLSVTHGIIRFVLHQASYEWRFIPTKGDIGDSGAGVCH